MSKIIKTIIYNEKKYSVSLERKSNIWDFSINGTKCTNVKILDKKKGAVAIIPESDDKLMVISNGITIHILEVDSKVELTKQATELLSTGLPKILDFVLFLPFLVVAIFFSKHVNAEGSLKLHLLTYPMVYLSAIAIGVEVCLKPTYSPAKKKWCYFASVIIAAIICMIYSLIVYYC